MSTMARRVLYLGFGLVSLTHALDLSTFAGQAEASLLQESTINVSDKEAVRMLRVAEAAEENDYTCTADRKCKLGCCKL